MVAPAEPDISRDLGVDTTIELELIFSIFLLAFIIGPLFLAPLSEVYGRVIVLQLANVVRCSPADVLQKTRSLRVY